MPRKISLYIIDIFLAFQKINRYIENFENAYQFYRSDIHWDAVMREFQIIGDATKNLIENNFLSRKYRMIVDFRNLIIHAYFGIDYEMVWDIINNELSPFLSEIKSKIFQLDIDVTDAIKFSIKEEQNANRLQNVEFLNSLLKELDIK